MLCPDAKSDLLIPTGWTKISTPSRAVVLVICGRRSLQRPLTRSFPTNAGEPRRSSRLPNRFIIVADYRKNSEHLGTNVSFLTFCLPARMIND